MRSVPARIAVTGANGFLGRHIVRALLAAGHNVVAVVRDPTSAAALLPAQAALRAADLADASALRQAFTDCDAVIANAVIKDNWFDSTIVQRNATGAEHVCAAAKQSGAQRVIHISATAVYRRPSGLVSEDGPVHTAQRTPVFFQRYHLSKAATERVVWRHSVECGLEVTALRPNFLVGDDDGGPWPTARSMAERRLRAWPLGIEADVAHASDVAQALVRCLHDPTRTVGKAYNVTGRPLASWRVWRHLREQDAAVPGLTIPVWTPLKLRFDNRRAQRDLGFEARDPLEYVLARIEAAHPEGPSGPAVASSG